MQQFKIFLGTDKRVSANLLKKQIERAHKERQDDLDESAAANKLDDILEFGAPAPSKPEFQEINNLKCLKSQLNTCILSNRSIFNKCADYQINFEG